MTGVLAVVVLLLVDTAWAFVGNVPFLVVVLVVDRVSSLPISGLVGQFLLVLPFANQLE